MSQKFDDKGNETEIEENETEKKQSGRGRVMETLRELVIYALIIVICIYVMPRYVIQRTIIEGHSMENTLQDGDNVLVEKLFLRVSEPGRFDIVMFYPYGVEEEDYYVKRVIGLPGETVQIIGEDIYINGEKLEENYGKQPITYQGIAAEPLTLGEDEYFLLGDNREVSFDSRYEEIGPVKKELIAGRAVLRIWPLGEFGGIA